MQSVSLKKSLTYLASAPRIRDTRPFSFHLPANPVALKVAFRVALLAAICLLPSLISARAQDTQAIPAAPEVREKFDLGVGGFYQITNASNGNFIREDTTSSGGALISFRQPLRPWLGYEANVGFTKFYESYNKNVVKLESNVTDVTFSYLLQAPVYYGFAPFFTIGGGVIVFSPIQGSITDVTGVLPTHLGSQLLPEFNYTVGLNYPVYGHFGVRGQLRGLEYKTPDFHQNALNTHTLRSTVEPSLSVYYRF